VFPDLGQVGRRSSFCRKNGGEALFSAVLSESRYREQKVFQTIVWGGGQPAL
jgi:hypothetical protein